MWIVEQTRRDWRKLPPVTETSSSALHCYSPSFTVCRYLLLSLPFLTLCYRLLQFVTICYFLLPFVTVCYHLSLLVTICQFMLLFESVLMFRWFVIGMISNCHQFGSVELGTFWESVEKYFGPIWKCEQNGAEFDNLSKKKSQQAIRGRQAIDQLGVISKHS